MSSYTIKYIFVAVDYVLKWVEAVVLPNHKYKNVTTFIKKFSRFVTPREIIIDGVPTFAISCSNHYLGNMVFATI